MCLKMKKDVLERNHILELVKEFDVTFNTDVAEHINSDVTSIIKDLFMEYVENIYIPSEKYRQIGKEAKKKRAELERTMSSDQKELLEDLCESENHKSDELIEQSFVYGFCLANQLRDEVGHIYNITKKDNVS